jgi:uncharacterized glyoxalase superfamily protein PhnB
MPSLYMVGPLPGNLRRSVEFYRRPSVEPTQIDEREHFRTVAAPGVQLFLDASGSIAPRGSGGVVLEFRFPDTRAVDATFGALVGAGAPVERRPSSTPVGEYVGLVRDPDGNLVALSAPTRDGGTAGRTASRSQAVG